MSSMRTVVLASLVVFLSPFISTVSTAKQKSSASIITTKDGSTYLVSTIGQNHSSKSEDYKDGQRRQAHFHLRNHCRGQSQSSCQSTGLLSLTIVLIGINANICIYAKVFESPPITNNQPPLLDPPWPLNKWLHIFNVRVIYDYDIENMICYIK